VNGYFVLKRDYSQDTIVKFGDRSPKAKTILLLWFAPNWVVENLNTPLLFQIRTFAQDFVLEVVSELVRFHAMKLSDSQLAWEGVA